VTSKRVAPICRHQLSFLLLNKIICVFRGLHNFELLFTSRISRSKGHVRTVKIFFYSGKHV